MKSMSWDFIYGGEVSNGKISCILDVDLARPANIIRIGLPFLIAGFVDMRSRFSRISRRVAAELHKRMIRS